MIDLVQLISIPQATNEADLGLQDNSDDSNLSGNTAFMAILAHLLINESDLPGVEEANLKTINEDNELVLSSGQNEKQSSEDTLVVSEELERFTPKPFEKIERLMEDNLQLAWFNIPSFEPPQVNMELSREERTPLSLKNAAAEFNLAEMAGTQLDPEIGNTSGLIESESSKGIIPFINQQGLDNGFLTAGSPDDSVVGSKQQTAETAPIQPAVYGDAFASNLVKSSDNLLAFSAHASDEPTTDEVSNTTSTQSLAANQSAVESTIPVAAKKMIDLPSNISNSDWGEQFNQQIVWLGQQKIKTAIIKLNPQELGPLEVNIKMVKDTANLNITAHTMQVRDLIEQALPRLREMMMEQGVTLSQVNVESNNNQHQGHYQPRENWSVSPDEGREDAVVTSLDGAKINNTKGIIDYFA
ncbi:MULTISPECIES: flagellar hook-length control protein FliK [unclassified Legionella]|uniref:flagellar hook-length control protein FliK n=1 Tax=unclassified Legionella TaxID=2622702 RepID=UPI001055245D|nr:MULTISPECIES: flagellar hook-length control protein FliK [unclassified Legionella]MDI9818398.1 flagellar hook-length control protein FliK [Legionella sp. PL877]